MATSGTVTYLPLEKRHFSCQFRGEICAKKEPSRRGKVILPYFFAFVNSFLKIFLFTSKQHIYNVTFAADTLGGKQTSSIINVNQQRLEKRCQRRSFGSAETLAVYAKLLLINLNMIRIQRFERLVTECIEIELRFFRENIFKLGTGFRMTGSKDRTAVLIGKD